MISLRSRPLAALVAGATLVAVTVATPTGAAPAEAATPAATVNGVAIDRSLLEATLVELGAPEAVSGDGARGVLTELVLVEAMRQALVAADVDVDDLDIDTIDPMTGQPLPESIAAGETLRAALAELHDVDTSELADEYSTGGTAGGFRCAVLLFTSDPAIDVNDLGAAVEELADGADPDEVAEGHELQGGGFGGGIANPCAPAAFDPSLEPLLDALDDTGAGESTEALDLDGVIVIAWIPPFDDVASVVAAPFLNEATGEIIAELLADAEVTVDPRYGRWDSEALAVVPLGA